MTEAPAKRRKVGRNSQTPRDTPSFEDFAPDGDVIFIVKGKTRVRVHSVVIKCASPVFTAMLKPSFKEGRALAESGDSPIEIPLPEDNPEEWGWICRALHCQAHIMLWKPTLLQLWLAGELQAMRDCAMMKAIKFVYSDLLVTLRMGCAKCTETYFQAVERELVKRTRQPTFMEANSELAVVPHVVSAING
ncbi:hypothetical protein FGSG_04047 [Fusarium graminearum PH-1]|uniref:hypothetical protein n=1 Tax=Gibberella zeae (strain ATCC MYA-4620 / CBS 123657 / FGSC 9075 / NRRL 31084 / PH-1) TaxID=229533 RepID=UPI000023EC92|nr:hypothetical protein FGSG_04047 [Fusarium graminearum PH-1]ESU09107.1 hypothetical protein FGSG_04047 [Fusarium graminearum PH-1]|eukprot:XP_011321606.1 hypothetical protein FGSG_04047 [Fusarium graminearum PH-1]